MPFIGEELLCIREDRNLSDSYAVLMAVIKSSHVVVADHFLSSFPKYLKGGRHAKNFLIYALNG